MTDEYKMKKYKLKYILGKKMQVAGASQPIPVLVGSIPINPLDLLTFLVRKDGTYRSRCILSFTHNNTAYLMDINRKVTGEKNREVTSVDFNLYYGYLENGIPFITKNDGSRFNLLNQDDQKKQELRIVISDQNNIFNRFSDYLGHVNNGTSGFRKVGELNY